MKGKITKGFTLVELMVVVAIIALLSVGSFIYFSGYFSDTRNATRQSQIDDIVKALDLYSISKGTLPKCANAGIACDFNKGGVNGIDETDWTSLGMTSVPSDPKKKSTGNTIYYKYFIDDATNPKEYRIWATLEPMKGFFKGSKGTIVYPEPEVSLLPSHAVASVSDTPLLSTTFFDPIIKPTCDDTNNDGYADDCKEGGNMTDYKCTNYKECGKVYPPTPGTGYTPKGESCRLDENSPNKCLPYIW